MINRVVLVGRLTRDPELKYTTNGIANLRFSIAVNRTFTSQNGERQADFINCVAWRGQAENMAKFLRKGSLIGVEGRIETGSYQAQDGSMRYTTDVVCDSVQFLEPRSASADRGNFGAQHRKTLVEALEVDTVVRHHSNNKRQHQMALVEILSEEHQVWIKASEIHRNHLIMSQISAQLLIFLMMIYHFNF